MKIFFEIIYQIVQISLNLLRHFSISSIKTIFRKKCKENICCCSKFATSPSFDASISWWWTRSLDLNNFSRWLNQNDTEFCFFPNGIDVRVPSQQVSFAKSFHNIHSATLNFVRIELSQVKLWQTTSRGVTGWYIRTGTIASELKNQINSKMHFL